jgi:hypothetical protein
VIYGTVQGSNNRRRNRSHYGERQVVEGQEHGRYKADTAWAIL